MSVFNSKFKIQKVEAYEVFDSRGWPTVCARISTKDAFATAMVPSGASTGSKEAVELRDNDPKRFLGKGVLQAVANINQTIAPKLINQECTQQNKIDALLQELDATPNKSKLGANATLAVSLANVKLAALMLQKPLYQYVHEHLLQKTKDTYTLPTPMMNVINGGVHASNGLDFQEFMYVPIGADSFFDALRMVSECFHHLQKILVGKKFNTNKGDEGGFAPELFQAEAALNLMGLAVKKAGYVLGTDLVFALDSAASEFYDPFKKQYVWKKLLQAKKANKKNAIKTSAQMVAYWQKLVKRFPIISIEDGLSENDFEGFALMCQKLGHKLQIVGDDLFCTNIKLVQKGIELNLANAVLIKPNQIGTLTETIQTVQLAQNAGWNCILSHRSGETEDTTIADLAVGLSVGQIKTGSITRSERVAKYNRLLAIAYDLQTRGQYCGKQPFSFFKEWTK